MNDDLVSGTMLANDTSEAYSSPASPAITPPPFSLVALADTKPATPGTEVAPEAKLPINDLTRHKLASHIRAIANAANALSGNSENLIYMHHEKNAGPALVLFQEATRLRNAANTALVALGETPVTEVVHKRGDNPIQADQALATVRNMGAEFIDDHRNSEYSSHEVTRKVSAVMHEVSELATYCKHEEKAAVATAKNAAAAAAKTS